MTTRPGVFAGGDAVTGPNTVVEAMAAGKLAANMIEKYVSGLTLKPDYNLTRPSVYVKPWMLSEEEVLTAKRPANLHLHLKDRAKNFKEVDLGMAEAQAITEARRCLRCDLETADGKKAMGDNT